MKRLRGLDLTVLILVIVGGINWLTIGIFNWNFVHAIFNGFILERITYIVVGAAAVYALVRSPHLAHLRERREAKKEAPVG